jgi:signal transduction histidine kinase
VPGVLGLGSRRNSRSFWVLAVLVGAFLVLDLALFAWLIFRSLSQRELDRVLLETREEAQDLAGRIHRSAERTGGDLFTAVALEQETQTYIDSVLRQRQIVQTVEITDKNGVLVMKERREAEIALPGQPSPDDNELQGAPPHVESRTVEHRQTSKVPLTNDELGSLDVTVPIGKFGSLRIGLSAVEMDRRIAQLRRDLVRQTALIGGLTAVLIAVAVALISVLIRRGERLEAQASEAERLAYVGTLAAGLAHEIRNPLNSLNLNMQMLEEDLPATVATETGGRLLAITRSEIARLERLVSEFLAYARPRPLQLEETAAIDLLLSAREVLAAQLAQREVAVRIVDESEEASVRVDHEQIQQLLLNLLQNALTATETVSRRPVVTLFARREGSRVELEVRDNGRGIPPGDRDKIFDAFFSTRKGGTGLGLAIAQRIARAHGGSLRVDSELDFGTSFVLTLPVSSGDPEGDELVR